MGIVAELSLPKIDSLLEKGNVVVESMYSWEEYLILKERYGEDFRVVAVYASSATRYARLGKRNERPLTQEEAMSRDYTQIANIHTGGPIAMADYTITNENSLEDLQKKTKAFIETITTE
jgi:dephospho-CoA kinase